MIREVMTGMEALERGGEKELSHSFEGVSFV